MNDDKKPTKKRPAGFRIINGQVVRDPKPEGDK